MGLNKRKNIERGKIECFFKFIMSKSGDNAARPSFSLFLGSTVKAVKVYM